MYQALQGKSRITKDLDELLTCLENNNIPREWKKLCPPTNKKVIKWLQHLMQRHDQYYDWV